MTEQEWLEAKRKGEALRTRIESNICNVLVKSGVMADCLAYIEAAQQLRALDAATLWVCEWCGVDNKSESLACFLCDTPRQ